MLQQKSREPVYAIALQIIALQIIACILQHFIIVEYVIAKQQITCICCYSNVELLQCACILQHFIIVVMYLNITVFRSSRVVYSSRVQYLYMLQQQKTSSVPVYYILSQQQKKPIQQFEILVVNLQIAAPHTSRVPIYNNTELQCT